MAPSFCRLFWFWDLCILLISTDFAGILQPIRRKTFLYGAGFHLILSLLEAEQQVRKVKDDSLENETCLTCGNCTLTCGKS